MGNIVCATRGGSGSRALQRAAIARAREQGSDLVFLFVVDTSSVEGEEPELIRAIHDELRFLGQTLLRVAKKRAAHFQVDADIVIREGKVKEEIDKFLAESQAELLLLGAPRGTTETTFGDDVIEQFALTIHRDTGVEVEIIRPSEP